MVSKKNSLFVSEFLCSVKQRLTIALVVLSLGFAVSLGVFFYRPLSLSFENIAASILSEPVECYKSVGGVVTLQCGLSGCMNVLNGSYCTADGKCFDYFEAPILRGKLYPVEEVIDPVCRDVFGNPLQSFSPRPTPLVQPQGSFDRSSVFEQGSFIGDQGLPAVEQFGVKDSQDEEIQALRNQLEVLRASKDLEIGRLKRNIFTLKRALEEAKRR